MKKVNIALFPKWSLQRCHKKRNFSGKRDLLKKRFIIPKRCNLKHVRRLIFSRNFKEFQKGIFKDNASIKKSLIATANDFSTIVRYQRAVSSSSANFLYIVNATYLYGLVIIIIIIINISTINPKINMCPYFKYVIRAVCMKQLLIKGATVLKTMENNTSH